MSQPYIGEVRMFAGNFAPNGWAFCNGQMLPISENDVLFNLIGTTYGGDGQETFALPNLQSRIPIHAGNSYVLAQTLGTETETLTTSQIPSHNHAVVATTNPASPAYTATSGLIGNTGGTNLYGLWQTPVAMLPHAIGSAGGSQPHENMAPFLCINFIISLFGVYPSPT